MPKTEGAQPVDSRKLDSIVLEVRYMRFLRAVCEVITTLQTF